MIRFLLDLLLFVGIFGGLGALLTAGLVIGPKFDDWRGHECVFRIEHQGRAIYVHSVPSILRFGKWTDTQIGSFELHNLLADGVPMVGVGNKKRIEGGASWLMPGN